METATVLPSVASGSTRFSTLSHKRHDFRQKVVYKNQNTHFMFNNLNAETSSCKIPVILVGF
jgi:hypothetical protein